MPIRPANQYRNPAETLDWFGIRDDLTVVEISPGGGGWYSEILAPYLRDNGKLYVGSYDSESEVEYYRRNYRKYADKLAADPDNYGKVVMFEFAPPNKQDLQTGRAGGHGADLPQRPQLVE